MYPNQNLPQLNNQIPPNFGYNNQIPNYPQNNLAQYQLGPQVQNQYIDPKFFDPANNPYLQNLKPLDEKLLKYLKPRPVDNFYSTSQSQYLPVQQQQSNYNPILNNNFAYAPVQNQFQQYAQPGYNQAYQNLYNAYQPSQLELGYQPAFPSGIPSIDPSYLLPQQPLSVQNDSLNINYSGGSKESFHVASSEVAADSSSESNIEQVVEKQVEDKAEIEKKIADLADQLKKETVKMQNLKKQQQVAANAQALDDKAASGPVNLKSKGAIEKILKEISVYGYKPSQDVIKKMANTSEYDHLWENFKPNSSKAWMYAFFARMVMKRESGK